jgi:hypothetical protein
MGMAISSGDLSGRGVGGGVVASGAASCFDENSAVCGERTNLANFGFTVSRLSQFGE